MEAMRAVRLVKPKTLILFAGLALWAATGYAADPAGVIFKIKGDVKVESGHSSAKAAVEGDKFFIGDTFVTGSDGRVKLRFAEGGPNGKNEVVIAGSSRLFIEKAGSASSGKTGTSLSLESGTMRSDVKHKYSGDGEDVFKVRTPNAVAGVRGTIFLLSFDPKTNSSTLLTQQGKVAFTIGSKTSFCGVGQVVRGKGTEMGNVLKADKNNVPGVIQNLQKEIGSGNGNGPGESNNQGNNVKGNGGQAGQAPPAPLDHEKVAPPSTESGSPTASGGSSGPAPATTTTTSGSTPTATATGTTTTSESSTGPAPASVSTDTSTSGSTTTSSTSTTSTSTGSVLGTTTTTTTTTSPVVAPPPIYVPPISPITIIQNKPTAGTVAIPIHN